MYFYGLQNFFFLLIMIAMLNSGHIDIYTVYKQCLEKCSSKVISTTQHKCSVFQLFTDQLARNILGCDNRVCKLSVSFASLDLSSRRLSAGSPHQAVACLGLCVGSLSDAGSRGKPHGARTGSSRPLLHRVGSSSKPDAETACSLLVLWEQVSGNRARHCPSGGCQSLEICWTDHHGRGLKWVAGALPVVPLNTVELICVLPLWVVHSIQVGRTTGIKPPACEREAQKELGARQPWLSHLWVGNASSSESHIPGLWSMCPEPLLSVGRAAWQRGAWLSISALVGPWLPKAHVLRSSLTSLCCGEGPVTRRTWLGEPGDSWKWGRVRTWRMGGWVSWGQAHHLSCPSHTVDQTDSGCPSTTKKVFLLKA